METEMNRSAQLHEAVHNALDAMTGEDQAQAALDFVTECHEDSFRDWLYSREEARLSDQRGSQWESAA